MAGIYLRACEFIFNAETKAMINIRQKGANAEREVVNMLNGLAIDARKQRGLPALDKQDLPVQRNPLQAAIGGGDITNPFGFDIEVKNCAQLSINTWWKQCTASAERSGGTPVLMYKVARKGWRVVMMTDIEDMTVIAEISKEAFLDIAERRIVEYYESREHKPW